MDACHIIGKRLCGRRTKLPLEVFMTGPVWENPELYALCMKHGTRISKHETVTQVAILDLYDAVLELVKRSNGNIQQQVQADSSTPNSLT